MKIVNIVASSMVDRNFKVILFELQSGQTIDYANGKHASLRCKRKE